MTNEQLIQTVKEAMRNDTVLNKGVVELLCNALLAVTEQRDAVVVEMALLKDVIREVNKTAEECELNGDELRYVVGTDEFERLTDMLDETPATDAAIAALRAEGVEMFGELIAHTSGVLYSESVKSTISDFARQLRESKGASHE